MSVLHQMRAWVGANLRRSRMESEMEAEMRFHVEAYAHDLERGGLERAEALRRARMEFGGVEQKKEECREARGVTLVENFLQDLRFGVRMLRKNPGFTAVAVLTLALGIGANAAIFTVINAILLRPLSVQHPEELVAVGDPTRVHAWSTGTPDTRSFSYPLYHEVREQNEVFTSLLASSRLDNARVVIDKGTEDVTGRTVSENYFETLGAEALIGRTFSAADGEVPGRDPLLVLSYRYWQKRFQGNSGVIGRTVKLNGIPMTIIGVMGANFFGEVVEDQVDLWAPMMMEPQLMPDRAYLESANVMSLLLIGRLKPGVSMSQAKANLDGLVKRALEGPLDGKLSADDRDAVRKKKIDVQVSGGGRGLSRVRQEFGAPLLLLMAMVGLVLLVACINVANLMLARATARQREMAIRFAIGAGAGRVIRQLMTESLLLAGLGGTAGLLLAKWGADTLVKMADAGAGVRSRLALDWRVLGFTAGACVLAAVVFGLGPALQFLRVRVGTALKEGGRDFAGGRKGRGGRLLLSAQIAVGVFVLIGASLLVRSLSNLQSADLGYSREKLLLVRLDVGASGYKRTEIAAVTQELLQRLAALPGVEGATASSNGLYSGSESADAILLDGAAPVNADKDTADDEVGPNYFSTIGVPVVLGREITHEDYLRGARVMVVNEAFAKYYFAGRNAIGHSIKIEDSEHPNAPGYEIIGVARDVKDHDVREQARRRMYAPLSAGGFDQSGAVNFEIRTANPNAIVNSVRSAILTMNPEFLIDNIESANDLVGDTLSSQVLVAQLSAMFGGLVLVLVCIGLYGSMAYNVAMRTKEIGLRMALGVPRGAVVWMVAREAWLVLVAGVLVGVPAGIVGSRLFRAMLFQVGGGDPVAISWAILALVCVCLAAAIVPARRAVRVEPMVALRYE
ncbi:MAG TPA: ABC transporter permease [Candidatus Acidoferrum sp.]|nr:ABC transporter permease [Candidatus Acidoferrum sp.]